MIKHSIEINRPAEEVFAYLDQVDRHNEWQGQLVSTTIETDGPVRVGTRVVERRNVPGGARDFPYEITEHDPPRKVSFRGTAGLIRPAGTYTVDPIGESSSRMNLRARPRGSRHRQAVCTPGAPAGCQAGAGRPQEVQRAARKRRRDETCSTRVTHISTPSGAVSQRAERALVANRGL